MVCQPVPTRSFTPWSASVLGHVAHASVAWPSRLTILVRQRHWNCRLSETSDTSMAATDRTILLPNRHTTQLHVLLSDTAALDSLLLVPLPPSTPLPQLALTLLAPHLPEPLLVPQPPSVERQPLTAPTALPMSDPAALVPQVLVVAAAPC